MITARQANLLTKKYYKPFDKKAFYDNLEQEIINAANKGEHDVYMVIDNKEIVTRKDARDIKRCLKQHGFSFVSIEIDTIQSVSCHW